MKTANFFIVPAPLKISAGRNKDAAKLTKDANRQGKKEGEKGRRGEREKRKFIASNLNLRIF
jgi:hypothetical protein